ncbi:MAG: hypothetical protein DMD98_12730 [Candidatus Rokuibacteriota bacterium]|nr:MAG: hypothetical protein DMD98_12730 [Candidatus Rokubacteria bacterium]
MRWALAAIAALLLLGVIAAAAARFLGRPGSRASIFVSVVASWLGAWVLWGFAGGLLVRYGLLSTYYGALFAPVALVGAIVQYRAHVRAGRVEGLAVFVGGQLAWLAVVLLQNGALGDVWGLR